MRQGFIAQRSAEGYNGMALAVICKMPFIATISRIALKEAPEELQAIGVE